VKRGNTKIISNFLDFRSRNDLVAIFSCILIVTTAVFCSDSAQAEPKRKRLKISRSYNSTSQNINDYSLSDSIGEILSGSAETDLYDPLSLIQLQRLRDRALPWWEGPDAIDDNEARKVVEKALAIQSTTNFLALLSRSDIRYEYKDVSRGFKFFSSYFRYALQDTGESYIVSRENKGKNLVDIGLKLSLNKGADPQVHLGDDLRLRYDWTEQETLLEYGFNF